MTELVLGGRTFYIPKWNMRRQLKNQKSVLPLVTRPISAAVAMADEKGDEQLFVAAIVEGVMKALQETDLEAISSDLLYDVTYRTDGGGKGVLTSLEDIEKLGLTLADFYKIVIAVIKENYGPLLKDGLQDVMGSLTGGTE